MATILVVDDELGIRALLSEILSDEGHTVELAENAAQARVVRARTRTDLVLLDIWMPDVDGITLLKEWAGQGLLTMPVIMMSGHGTMDTAAEALRHGAVAFLEKPITLQKLLKAVDQSLARPGPGSPAGSSTPAPASGQRADPHAMGRPAATGPALPPGTPATVPDPAGIPAWQTGGAGWPADPPARQLFDLDRPLREARDAFEKSYFEFHLSQEGGSMTRVADKTGLERTHLYRKLKQLGVDLSRGKRGS